MAKNKVIGLISAVKRETQIVKLDMVIEAQGQELPLTIYRGRYEGCHIILVQSGIGTTKAVKAAEYLVKEPADLIISFGFAGAIGPGMRVGDLVIADEIAQINEHKPITRFRATPNLVKGLEELCRQAKLSFKIGGLLTVSQAITQSRLKQGLYQTSTALAVEMESEAIARVCLEAGIPFACLRVISDMADESFEFEFKKVKRNNNEAIDWCRLISYLTLHPGQVSQAFHIWTNLLQAERVLKAAIAAIIPGIVAREE